MPIGEPEAVLPPAEAKVESAAGSLLDDLVTLFLMPTQLFRRLPVVNRGGAALALLLVFQVSYAIGVISTGVLDYEIDIQTEKQASQQAILQEGEQKSKELDQALESLDKAAIFSKLLARVVLVIGEPLRLLVGIGLLAGLLFVAVALFGGKPDFSVLAGLVVFASWVEVPRLALRLYLLSQIGASRVDTSAAAFVHHTAQGLPVYLLLRQLDPFALWFWILVGLGLVTSGQLQRRAAIRVVFGLVFLSMGWRLVLDLLEVTDLTALMQEGESQK
jgi:hypothetical protein